MCGRGYPDVEWTRNETQDVSSETTGNGIGGRETNDSTADGRALYTPGVLVLIAFDFSRSLRKTAKTVRSRYRRFRLSPRDPREHRVLDATIITVVIDPLVCFSGFFRQRSRSSDRTLRPTSITFLTRKPLVFSSSSCNTRFTTRVLDGVVL